MAERTPANHNPWYILMTLYGEQEEKWVNGILHAKNRAAWNAWACQAMTPDARIEVAKKAGVDLAEVQGWDGKRDEIAKLHEKVWVARNGKDLTYPGLPDVADAVNVREIAFSNTVALGGAIFSGIAYFYSAHFSGKALFYYAQFSGFAKFQKATFVAGNEEEGEVSFKDCQFEKPTSFRDAGFLTGYPDFDGAVLHQNTAFTAADEYWPTGAPDNPKAARASCAVIRHSLDKQGLPEDQHFFFRREMAFAGRIGNWGQRLPYRLFGAVSEYGYSILKPSLWLLGLWIVPALIYMGYFNWLNELYDGKHGALEGFAISFVSMFNFLGLHRLYFGTEYYQSLNPFVQFLTAGQTVLGVILLFFLGLALRTRFRLR